VVGNGGRIEMGIQVLTKTQFDKTAKGLPYLLRPDLSAEVVYIEEIDSEYFKNAEQRQRCIVKRKDGNLYLSFYD
jgi:hypothetical protein